VSELLVFGRILVCSTPNVNENRFRNAVNGSRTALTAKGPGAQASGPLR
jgi:hypothetical protein